MTEPTSTEPSYFKRSSQFLFDYFKRSENKKKAWLLWAGSVLSVMAITGLGFFLGWYCFPLMYSAFLAKDLSLVLIGAGYALLSAAGMAGFNYLANYLKNTLYVDWRSWLTKQVIHQYLHSKTNYLKISRIYKELDNPEQRIQEDIDKVVQSAVNLSIGFIKNFCSLVAYTVLLGMAGVSTAALLGTSVMIPGYLIFIALSVGTATSLISYFINRSLQKVTDEESTIQSNLRADLQQLKTSSEEIAIERAEPYYQNRLEKEVDDLSQRTTDRLLVQNSTISFNLFSSIFQGIVSLLAAVPLYFSNFITLDVFYSVNYYFIMVSESLNWFVESYEVINQFKTSLSRVVALKKLLDDEPVEESTAAIIRKTNFDNQLIEVKKLDLKLHDGSEVIIKGLDLKFTKGIHTLITAPSGTGKSSLFKAIAGTWISGEGEITISGGLESLYFLPQKPTLPDDTLRKVLAYPDINVTYSDEALIAALNAVDMESLSTKLDEKVGFKSLGEQQRIAFARVLLRKPDWVFLDEATASLDESVEEKVYSNIKELLPQTTIISIAHRSTVKRYHDNVLFFNINDYNEVQVEEERIERVKGL